MGYNLRMPSLNASLGISQLKKINTQVKKKNLRKYKKLFIKQKNIFIYMVRIKIKKVLLVTMHNYK